MIFEALALAAAAATAAPTPVVSSADPQSVVRYLQESGFQAKLDLTEDVPTITSAQSGRPFLVIFMNCEKGRNCDDMQFYAGWESKEKPVSLEVVNAFNRDNRFAKAYIDAENDPVIEMDLLFSEKQMTEKMFGENLALWGRLVAEFAKQIGRD